MVWWCVVVVWLWCMRFGFDNLTMACYFSDGSDTGDLISVQSSRDRLRVHLAARCFRRGWLLHLRVRTAPQSFREDQKKKNSTLVYNCRWEWKKQNSHHARLWEKKNLVLRMHLHCETCMVWQGETCYLWILIWWSRLDANSSNWCYPYYLCRRRQRITTITTITIIT